MEVNNEGQLEAESQQMEMKPIGKEQLKKFTKILREYKAGKGRSPHGERGLKFMQNGRAT